MFSKTGENFVRVGQRALVGACAAARAACVAQQGRGSATHCSACCSLPALDDTIKWNGRLQAVQTGAGGSL